MSIKNKAVPVPPDSYPPPYAEDTHCWGCGRFFYQMEIRADSELCYKCHRIVFPPPSA